MSSKFVRKTGSDSNSGNSAGAAYLTIGKALGATGMASGDVLWIGAGVYRENITVAMTNPAAETKIIGDVDGAQTGDAGEVILTGCTTSDVSATGGVTIDLNGRKNLTFQYLTLVGAGGNYILQATTATSSNLTVRDCCFIAGSNLNQTCLRVFPAVNAANNLLVERCIFNCWGQTNGIDFSIPTSTTADYSIAAVIQNCVFYGALHAVTASSSGANAFKGGGITLYNCHALCSQGAFVTSGSLSTTFPFNIYNSVIETSTTALSAGTAGQIVEDYNIIGAQTLRTNVTAGTHSISNGSYSRLFESGMPSLIGKLTRHPYEPKASSPFLGYGNQAGGPAVDLLNRPRPAGGSSTTYAIGAYERHNTGAREASVVDSSTYSLKLTGPADHDVLIPVNAAATTITLRARYDTNHATTNKPQVILQANGEIGVATQTVTMTAGVDTWETLTIGPFTPSAKGFVTVRLVARSAAGNGIAYFDTVVGTAIGTGNEDYWRRGEAFPAATTSTTSPWSFP